MKHKNLTSVESQESDALSTRTTIWARLRRLVGTAGLSYLGMALSLVSAPMLAQELGADGRGVLAGAFAAVQLLSWTAFLGLPRGLSVQGLKEKHIARSGVLALGALGVFSFVAIFFCADYIANDDSRIADLIRIASAPLLLTGFSQLGIEYLLSKGKMLAWNIIRSASIILPSLVIITAYMADFLSLQVAFYATLGGTVLAVVLGFFYSFRYLSKIKKKLHAPWRFSFELWSASSFDSVAGRLDQMLLAAFLPAAAVGNYAVAVTCASASGILTQAGNYLSYSRFLGSSIGGRKESIGHKSLIGITASAVSGVLIIAALSTYSDDIFGPTYGDLVPIAGGLIVFQLLNDQWQLRSYLDTSTGETRGLMVSSGAGLTVMIVAVVTLELTNFLNGFTMSCCMILFASTRLLFRYLIAKKLPETQVPS